LTLQAIILIFFYIFPIDHKEAMMKGIAAIGVLMLFWCSAAVGAIQTREVEYPAGETTMKGYLAYDDAMTGESPGVLVVHEWWGLNDYARKRAEMLADLGYTAMAVDMYGEGKTAEHPDTAAKFSNMLRENQDLAVMRFRAALNVLQTHPTVDKAKIAAIGYCFGGGVVLHMARAGLDLDGVVSFHGSLATENPAEPGTVKARVLVLNGAADTFVTEEQIEAFKKEMEQAGVDYLFINYPGVKHSFTNPDADQYGQRFDLPLAYDPEADRQSWQAMQDFLAEIFQ
jgi:dienelactone hydrolase